MSSRDDLRDASGAAPSGASRVRSLARYAPLAVTGLTFLVMYLVGMSVPEDVLRARIAEAGVLGPLLFMGLMLSAYVAAPMGNAPLLFAGFYAFGRAVVLYATLAALAASVVNFWLARKLGRSIVRRIAGDDKLGKLDRLATIHGLSSLILMRVLLGSMNEVISYAAGLTAMPFSVYLLGTVLGLVGNATVWYGVSLYAADAVAFTALSVATAGVLSTTFLAGSLVLRWWRARRTR